MGGIFPLSIIIIVFDDPRSWVLLDISRVTLTYLSIAKRFSDTKRGASPAIPRLPSLI